MILTDISQLPDLSRYDKIVVDVETSGLAPHSGDRICGVAIGPLHSDKEYYIPIRHSRARDTGATGRENDPFPIISPFSATDRVSPGPSPKNLPPAAVFSWLRLLMADPNRTWIAHNAAYELTMFRKEAIEIAGPIMDTMIAAHVYDGQYDYWEYGLDAATQRVLEGEFVHVWYHKIKAWLKSHQPTPKTWNNKHVAENYSLIPIPLLGEYAKEDIRATRALCLKLSEYFDDPKSRAYRRPLNQGNPASTQRELLDSDMHLVRTLFEMQYRGIRVDIPACVELRRKSLEEVDELYNQMYELAGRRFNPASWKQMWEALEATGGKVLFWMLPEERRGKQKLDQFTRKKAESTGRPCWNSVALLEYLKHFKEEGNQKAYDFILAYHEADMRSRLVSTNLDAYLRLTDPDGFLHGELLPHGTRTGRLSSQNPNCQNVGKAEGNATQKAFDAFLGRKDVDAIARQLRRMFIARDGNVLVSIDYSQLEYRVAAYLSADREFIARYQKDPALDYHTATSEMIKISRDITKNVNFGTLYGMGAKSLASLLTGYGFPTTTEEAQGYLDAIFAGRPALKGLIDSTGIVAIKHGQIQNALGRICKVAKDRSYVGVNYMVQGTCGDIMRRALVRVEEAIRKNNWPVHMCLTIHDEILFDMPPHLVHVLAPKLAAIMCEVPEITVPMLCDIEVGENWGEMVALEDWRKVA